MENSNSKKLYKGLIVFSLITILGACGSSVSESERYKNSVEAYQKLVTENLEKLNERNKKIKDQVKKTREKDEKNREKQREEIAEHIEKIKGLHGYVVLRGVMVKSKTALKDGFNDVFISKHNKYGQKALEAAREARRNFSPRTSNEVDLYDAESEIATLGCLKSDLWEGNNNLEVNTLLTSVGEESLIPVKLVDEDGFPNEIDIIEHKDTSYEYDRRKDNKGRLVEMKGRRVVAKTVVLCGTVPVKTEFLEVMADKVILFNFNYEMLGNYGYKDLVLMTNELKMVGNHNRITSVASSDTLDRAPLIHIEVGERITGKDILQVESYGAEVD